MRFIVDLYRYLIYAFCALALIGTTLIVLAVTDGSMLLGGALSATFIMAAVAAMIFLVLSLGGIAILVSIHDRHTEIAADVARAADQLAALVGAIERMSPGGRL